MKRRIALALATAALLSFPFEAYAQSGGSGGGSSGGSSTSGSGAAGTTAPGVTAPRTGGTVGTGADEAPAKQRGSGGVAGRNGQDGGSTVGSSENKADDPSLNQGIYRDPKKAGRGER